MTGAGQVTVTCGQCGWRISNDATTTVEKLSDHLQGCRRPPWYWWPRENPWFLAYLAAAIGFLVGLVLR